MAAVWAKDELEALPEIHPTTAFATVDDLRVCSCVLLPWRAAESQGWPVDGALAAITDEAISCLQDALADGRGDLVWGGDWNQALEGRDHVGAPAGRSALLALLKTLDLTAKTVVWTNTQSTVSTAASITSLSRNCGDRVTLRS